MEQRLGDWISTYTGKKFWVLDAKPEEVNLRDIAHALSMICRYNGHCKFFYSVAQHSLNVCELLQKEGYNYKMQLYGLLHDATEAYICDVPRPIKGNITNYKNIENNLAGTIWKAFNLSLPTEEEYQIIKDADNAMLKCEAKILMSDWQDWYLPYNDIDIKIVNREINDVKKEFKSTASVLLLAYETE